MLKTFTVTSRKDGSIGIPKILQYRLGLRPHTKYAITWDSSTSMFHVAPAVLVCRFCRQETTSLDENCDICASCMTEVQNYIRTGKSMVEALRAVSTKFSETEPMTVRKRK